MHKIMAQRGNNDFFSDNENFERGPPRHAGGNGNQGINFVWPNVSYEKPYKGHKCIQNKINNDSKPCKGHRVVIIQTHKF